MKHHGIGVGYRYPHEFEGADVEQQYLPDELAGRRYYLPTDQGYEATIAGRQTARAEARCAPRSRRGRTPRTQNPTPGRRQERSRCDARDEPQEARRDRDGRTRQGSSSTLEHRAADDARGHLLPRLVEPLQVVERKRLASASSRCILNQMVQYFGRLDSTPRSPRFGCHPTGRPGAAPDGPTRRSPTPSEAFHLTLTGMRKHVGVLEQADLVTTRKVGAGPDSARFGPRRLEDERPGSSGIAACGTSASTSWRGSSANDDGRSRSMDAPKRA